MRVASLATMLLGSISTTESNSRPLAADAGTTVTRRSRSLSRVATSIPDAAMIASVASTAVSVTITPTEPSLARQARS